MNLRGIPSKELRAELKRRERARNKRQLEKWRSQNHCRLESCDCSLRMQESHVIETDRHTPLYPDGTPNYFGNPNEGEIFKITIQVMEECDAGHVMLYHLDRIEDEPPFLSQGPYLQEKDWVFSNEL